MQGKIEIACEEVEKGTRVVITGNLQKFTSVDKLQLIESLMESLSYNRDETKLLMTHLLVTRLSKTHAINEGVNSNEVMIPQGVFDRIEKFKNDGHK